MTWEPAASFAGALTGAGVPALVAMRAQRLVRSGQEQDARGEWRQRLDRAIECVTSDERARQRIGRELLTDLIDSDLGSDQDRRLASRLALVQVVEPFLDVEPAFLDPVDLVSDNEEDGREDHDEHH